MVVPQRHQQQPLSSSSSSHRTNNNNRLRRAVRKSFPELVWLSRATYVAFCLICYSLVHVQWYNNEGHSLSEQESSSTELPPPLNQQQRIQQQSSSLSTESQKTFWNTSAITDTVAYVVTITGCGADLGIPFFIAEGAAILKHSIHIQHQQQQQEANGKEQRYYDYHLYAFYHPDGAACATPLVDLGYRIQERTTPVRVEDIQNDELRDKIVKNGCCGEKELIKFEAFTLVEYPIVVLLDLDVLILKPMNRLFDFFLDNNSTTVTPTTMIQFPHADDILRPDNAVPNRIDLLYTTDYGMVNAKRKIKPTQGGFAVLRPNKTVYEDFVSIVKRGDFRFDGPNGTGWGGATGRFWGAMTFQGLMPYYFQVLHPGRAVELNMCAWNNMCSPHRDDASKGGGCLTQLADDKCEDCRTRTVDRVALTHFTVCQKPWTCQLQDGHDLCKQFHHAWFQTRSAMEQSWGRSGRGTGTYHADHFLGYCSSYGIKGYQVLSKPYGRPLLAAS